jgi:hypothetical protein
VGPEAKRFAVATKADDANAPEHLWDLRALKFKWAPTSQEGKALTLLRDFLLKRWIKITTTSLLNFLDLKPTNLVISTQDDGQYGWLNSGRKAYCTWWHGSPSVWKPRCGDLKVLCTTHLLFILLELGWRLYSFLLALALRVQDTDERWDPLMVRFDFIPFI